MPCLLAIRGPSTGKRYTLDGECILGRSFNSDIYIGDLNVSRRHARIIGRPEGGHVVEDLGSGNGTFVNDRLVQRHALRAKDVVRIGGSAFRFEDDPVEPRLRPEVLTALSEIVEHETGEIRLGPTGEIQLGPATAEQAAKQRRKLAGMGQKRAVRMLEAMYAVADAVADEIDLPKLLDKVLGHIFGVFPQADRGFVLLVDSESGQLVPEAIKKRRAGDGSGIRFSQTIVDQVMRRGHGVIRGATVPPDGAVGNARPARPSPPSHSDKLLEEGTPFSLEDDKPVPEVPKMGAPLICRGEALGTLHIEGVRGSPSFSQEDLSLLSAIARQAALAIGNARATQALVAQERFQGDLQMARRIQESFLPRRVPTVPELEFEKYYLPAQHVGGDFYDIVCLGPSQYGILVGDVSGKGVSAALLMAKLTTAIRLYTQSNPDPASVMNHANRTLLETQQDAMFATVLFMLLDLKAGTFTVANAGHQPPMVCSHRFRGVSELDDATAVALGVVPDMEYPQEVYQLVPGDVVLLYTDGINEAMNRQNMEYGMKRLRRVVATGRAEPRVVVQRVVADVQRFVAGAPQSDDQTVVSFGMKVHDPTGPLPSTGD